MLEKVFADRTILVVEDEMLILLFIEDLLQELGCRAVLSAATVDQALALIEAHALDAATVDMNLNGVESLPIADALSKRGVPFIFLTGYTDRQSRGAHASRPILRKPFHEAALREALADVMA